jgi:DNA-binding response OmpR family regulator
LNAGESGLDVVIDLNKGRQLPLPAIVISADDSAQVRAKVRSEGYKFMAKPVNAGRLQAMIRNLVDTSDL